MPISGFPQSELITKSDSRHNIKFQVLHALSSLASPIPWRPFLHLTDFRSWLPCEARVNYVGDFGLHENLNYIDTMHFSSEDLGNRLVLVVEYAPHGTLLGYLRALRPSQDTALGEVIMTYWWTRARSLVAVLYSFVSDIASALVHLEKTAVRYLFILMIVNMAFAFRTHEILSLEVMAVN